MKALNIVRFRVRPGQAQQFVDEHRTLRPELKGFLGGSLVRTGERDFCLVGEWRNFQSLATARPQMIAVLDRLRGMLEDLGSGLGVTDPVSGEVVVKLPATRPAKKRAGSARGRTPRARKTRRG